MLLCEAEYHRDRFDSVESSLVGSVVNHSTSLLDVRNYHLTALDIVSRYMISEMHFRQEQHPLKLMPGRGCGRVITRLAM